MSDPVVTCYLLIFSHLIWSKLHLIPMSNIHCSDNLSRSVHEGATGEHLIILQYILFLLHISHSHCCLHLHKVERTHPTDY